MIYLNGTPINVTMFPDNTSQVWKLPTLDLLNTTYVNIRWDFSHEGEFMHLAQLKSLLRVNGIAADLKLSYLPYGRQDKRVSNETTFALWTFANLLNSLEFREVVCVDPHSHIASELIINFRAEYPIDEVDKIMELTSSTIMCFPDKGAMAKYKHLYSRPYTWGEKVRDQSTGNILKYDLANSSCVHEENVLIVDDICDGGMTFKLLAKDLLAAGATEVNLFVTHGIFSKGLRTLKESGINRIFTQDGEVSEVQGNLVYEKMS